MATPAAGPSQPAATSQLCNRCKEHEATLDIRGERVCNTCHTHYITLKTIKRIEALQRETRHRSSAKPLPHTQAQPPPPPRYLLGLSCGPSSTALLHVLSENLRQQRERERRPKFELVVVHVQTDEDQVGDGSCTSSSSNATTEAVSSSSSPSSATANNKNPLLPPLRAAFPTTTIHNVPLSGILGSPAVDWSSLPPVDASLPTPSRRLADLLARLPSATSRADVRRLLTRHALVGCALARRCDVLLLGCTTTALAELTLAETAKGRGFSLPWLVNDGVVAVPRGLGAGEGEGAVVVPGSGSAVDGGDGDDEATVVAGRDVDTRDADGGKTETVTETETETKTKTDKEESTKSESVLLPIYHPLREVFRKELLAYLSTNLTQSQFHPQQSLLTALFPSHSSSSSSPPPSNSSNAVVSHKDLSIDDVMSRYFADVELQYPSVVANVVRTTGKLTRANAGEVEGGGGEGLDRQRCGICAIGLDEAGDERWRGEIGLEGPVDDDGGLDSTGRRRKLCYGCERSTRG